MTIRELVARSAAVCVATICFFRSHGEEFAGAPTNITSGAAARAYSVRVLTRLADPILTALSRDRLGEKMPKADWDSGRRAFAPLEAFARLLTGMAPWLELGPETSAEGELRARYIQLAVKSIDNAVDPNARDFMNFTNGAQPLVDTAFLGQALLRAPTQLWGNLDLRSQKNVLAAFQATRGIKPGNNNWLLFSAMVECALWQYSGTCRMEPIQTAVTRHLEWYKGDGVYGDGPEFHWDFYNSYVIQPMLLDVLRVCRAKHHELGESYPLVLKRAQRYAEVLERLISPEGTFPVLGRSSSYRFAAFQALSQIALMHELAPDTPAPAVRAGLTAVIRHMMEAPGTFDQNGWLKPGAVGFQPSICESYISAGSPYLCAVGLLHLGLPASDPFWTEPDQAWTQKRIWAGANVPADHALK